MKKFLTLLVLSSMAMVSNFSHAAAPTLLSCDDFRPTSDAVNRFPELIGACQSVVEINGAQYAKFEAVVRRVSGRNVTLRIPAVNRTMRVSPPNNARVEIGGRKVRVRDLVRRQELSIYLAVTEFAEPVIDELAFLTDEDAIVSADAESVAALPTTASPWPFVTLFAVLMLGIGLALRRIRMQRIDS